MEGSGRRWQSQEAPVHQGCTGYPQRSDRLDPGAVFQSYKGQLGVHATLRSLAVEEIPVPAPRRSGTLWYDRLRT